MNIGIFKQIIDIKDTVITNGKLICYNNILPLQVKNNIKKYFENINDYYLANNINNTNNKFIYIYKIKAIMVCICSVRIYKDYILIRHVKINNNAKNSFIGKGYCSFFIHKVIKHIIKTHVNAPNIYKLYVAKDNIPAIKCYKNIGFKVINNDIIINNNIYDEMALVILN
jgi:hypothetical protein